MTSKPGLLASVPAEVLPERFISGKDFWTDGFSQELTSLFIAKLLLFFMAISLEPFNVFPVCISECIFPSIVFLSGSAWIFQWQQNRWVPSTCLFICLHLIVSTTLTKHKSVLSLASACSAGVIMQAWCCQSSMQELSDMPRPACFYAQAA